MSLSIKSRTSREWRLMEKELGEENLRGRSLFTGSIIDFCKDWLRINPTKYQENFLLDNSRFRVARWARQTGKSTTIVALSLYNALVKGAKRIVILAPSLRQSRKLIHRIGSLIPKEWSWILAGRRLKTRLEFANGSTIEALPNSPETIRGETCDLIILDEAAYVRWDRELYDSTIYAITTTDGSFLAVSTPGSRDSLFYEMCENDDLFGEFSRHHVSYRDALEPNGPLKQKVVDSLRVQMRQDPWRWQREMEAEFAEDEEAFFPLSLLTSCISYDLKTYNETTMMTGTVPEGIYYIGCDLGKKQDHSVVAVTEKKQGQVNLIHMKQFKLGTDYSHIMGYLNRLGQRLSTVKRTVIDQTGVGEFFVEQAIKEGIKQPEGVLLTIPEKEARMFYLRHLMEEGKLHISHDTDLMNEMNVEQYQLMKTGQIQFSNPTGTHDDRLWALALAVYPSRFETPTYHPVAIPGKHVGSLMPNLPRNLWKH
ncbi:MAG TPA: terminase family protein [Candidatus Dormibacteraeota bacterium]|nr:terminase family protein [Candidatus Dormibacteraeota bacterium]